MSSRSAGRVRPESDVGHSFDTQPKQRYDEYGPNQLTIATQSRPRPTLTR